MTIAPDSHLYSVRLSPDERNLLFEAHDCADGGGGEDIAPVDLTRIVDVSSGEEASDTDVLSLRHRETATDETQLWLESPKEPSRKPSVLWIDAFKKVISPSFLNSKLR